MGRDPRETYEGATRRRRDERRRSPDDESTRDVAETPTRDRRGAGTTDASRKSSDAYPESEDATTDGG